MLFPANPAVGDVFTDGRNRRRILSAQHIWIPGGSTYALGLPSTVAYAPTWTPDGSSTKWFEMTMTGALAIGALTHCKPGDPLLIYLKQDATGGRVPTFNAIYKFPGGAPPAWSTVANRQDRVRGFVKSVNNSGVATEITCDATINC